MGRFLLRARLANVLNQSLIKMIPELMLKMVMFMLQMIMMMMFSLLLQSNRSKKWFKWLVQPPTHDPNPPSPRPTVIGFKSPTPLHWLHALDEDHGEDLHHFYFHRHNACHHQQRHIFKFLHYLDILFGSNLCASLWMPKKVASLFVAHILLCQSHFSDQKQSRPSNGRESAVSKTRSPLRQTWRYLKKAFL